MTTELAEIFAIAMGGQINIPPIKERYEKLRKIIPEQYHKYLDIFDADLCSSKLTPRRPGYDFEINLIPGASVVTRTGPWTQAKTGSETLHTDSRNLSFRVRDPAHGLQEPVFQVTGPVTQAL